MKARKNQEIPNWEEDSGITEWRPKKNLGQNFLADPAMAMTIASVLEINGKKILEVGAGEGQITEYLCENVQKTGSITALEIDSYLVEKIAKKLKKSKNLSIRCIDALKFDFSGYFAIFGNLPYYISTPLLFKILESDAKYAVIMVQEEFGKRLVATKGESDFSRLTINIQSKFVAEIIDYIPPESFYPTPKVASVVVKLTRKPKTQQIEINPDLLRMAFCHKNKSLLNSLLAQRKEIGLDKKQVREIVEKQLENWKETKVRQLDLEDWSEITRKLKNFSSLKQV